LAVGFVVKDGFFVVDGDDRCRACGSTESLRCFPNTFPQCWRCNAKLVYLGRVPSAPCVTPNGRVDGHGAYIKTGFSLSEGKPFSICAFCEREL
jgi:hypothetical protein